MIIHSDKQLVLLYQVYLILFFTLDVPFKNGKYTHGEGDRWDSPAFASLSRSSIQSDSSFFLIIHFIHSLYKSQTTNSISFKEMTTNISFSSLFLNLPSFLLLTSLSMFFSDSQNKIRYCPSEIIFLEPIFSPLTESLS